MALKPALRIIGRRLYEAASRSAHDQGLSPEDFALVGSYKESTDRIYLTLGTDHPVDDRRWYADTLQQIRQSFPDYPHITMHLGLVIRKVQNLDELYWDVASTEDEIDLTNYLCEQSRP